MPPSDSSPGAPGDPWIGRSVASYVLIEKIGEGGMGLVYLGQHQSLRRPAAVKFLAPQLVKDQAFLELFFREADSAAALNHPNVVGVYDAGKLDDETYFFIMEYVPGRDLGALLRERGTLPVAEAVEYVRQAASALAHAHDKKIVHRDVKPENLILSEDRRIKVADLGLAKWSGDQDGILTQNGMVCGSPFYISPERLQDGNCSDPGTDIYSLGATLFHLLTGRIPYEGSSPPVIMARHLRDPVPDPHEVNPDLDPEICGILRKMMAKKREERYADMHEVEKTLNRYLDDLAARSEPASPRARRRVPAWMWIVFVLSVAAAVASTLWTLKPTTTPAAPAPSQSPKTSSTVPPSPPVTGAKPAPASPTPPVTEEATVLANFNNAESMAEGYMPWATNPPKPAGIYHVQIGPSDGTDDSPALVFGYDVSEPGSQCGINLLLGDRPTAGYEKLRFKVRSDGAESGSLEILMLRGPKGWSQQHTSVKDIGPTWKTVEIPLGTDLTLNQITFCVDGQTRKIGTFVIDDVALVRGTKSAR